jgi:hypothetical protein
VRSHTRGIGWSRELVAGIVVLATIITTIIAILLHYAKKPLAMETA